MAEPLFLARYIEKAGTGTLDMIDLCAQAGLATPAFRQDGGQFVLTLWRPQAGTKQGPSHSAPDTRRLSGNDPAPIPPQPTSEIPPDRARPGAAERTSQRQKMISDPIAANLRLNIEDFSYAPFEQEGGLCRVLQLFGAELSQLIETLNRELAA